MEGITLISRCAEPVRTVEGSVIVDCDDAGIIGIEIIGYSHLSGTSPCADDILAGAENLVSLGCDAESDVVTIQVRFGENKSQKSVLAVMGFDDKSRLVYVSIPDRIGTDGAAASL